ncbi:MAG: phosphomannomutase/phosphoglucomutase [Oscillospiraceae bacterium]
MKDYSKLKSGTDVRGVAENIFGKEINLTDEAVRDISAAFVLFLSKKANKESENLQISIGHDSRISADRISEIVSETLFKMGVRVLTCGLCTTPAMFMTTVDAACDGAVQITASHHPADRNGLKFFTRDGGLSGENIEEIVQTAGSFRFDFSKRGTIEPLDFMNTYAAGLRRMIADGLNQSEDKQPLSSFHIVVDAGNGAGGFYATEVLAKLGADISGSVFLNPDGMFPNHIPNPEDKTAMASICKAVSDSNADFGVIFDTDVDRAGCVDSHAEEINRNRLVALAAAIVLEDNPGATVVTDSVTSAGLKTFIETHLGGHHHRFRRGYKNVIDEAVRLCNNGVDTPLAIETSGHAALRENYFLDDGAYLITKIIIKLAQLKSEGKSLAQLISALGTPSESIELRFEIKCDDFKAYGARVISELERFCTSKENCKIADDNHEGIRISVGDGWFLLRLSVHDPLMPMNVESDHIGGTAEILYELYDFFKAQSFLDITPLENMLKLGRGN